MPPPDYDPQDQEHTVVSRGKSASGAPVRERQIGDVVGAQYRLKSILGRGGMGVVFKAQHLTIGREYALKTLSAERFDEANSKRFLTEGRAIARLEHRNIIKVYDMGIDASGCLYYVMDRLDGISLAETIDAHKILPLSTIIDIFVQVCAGLGFAHKQRLVHRDVKPTNIYLCRNESGSAASLSSSAKSILASPLVKIIDYGLVKEVSEDPFYVQSQTAIGVVCGSPHYMSPEQCTGGKIDERTDIYSLGCTLFECLTGEPPFNGKDGLDTAFMHQNQPAPTLRDFRPDKNYPDNLEQVVARMLAKNPSRRYQTMEQVAQDLERVKEGASINREASQNVASPSDFKGKAAHSDEQHNPIERFVRAHWPALAACLAGILICVVAVWATSAALFMPKNNDGRTLSAAGLIESPEAAHARDVFKNCPQISNGVTELHGLPKRVFNFPDVSLGFISWGVDNVGQQPAVGQVAVPPNESITLKLPRPEGLYTRVYPEILSKIGADDIEGIEVSEPMQHNQMRNYIGEIKPELIEVLSHWTNLYRVSFFHCTLKADAIKALDQLKKVREFRLRDTEFDEGELSQISWLKNITVLDVKGRKDVDKTLLKLAGAPNLVEINIDDTNPSDAGLKALSTCPALERLSIENLELDLVKAKILGDFPSLRYLNIRSCVVSKGALAPLAKLKKAKQINLIFASVNPEELDALRRALPNCQVKFKPYEGLKDF